MFILGNTIFPSSFIIMLQPLKIINTPREVNVGCGISVRFDEAFLAKAKMLVNRYPQTSFVGFFRVFISGSKYVAKRIG